MTPSPDPDAGPDDGEPSTDRTFPDGRVGRPDGTRALRPPSEDEPADPPDVPFLGPPLDHAVVENDDLPDECALFPYAETDEPVLGRWICALEDSFVAVGANR